MDLRRIVQRGVNKYQDKGLFPFLYSCIRSLHRITVRRYLPGRRQEVRGILIGGEERKIKPLDHLFGIRPWPQNHNESNCELIRAYSDIGDDIIVVGGGFGITTVEAAKAVGDSGSILTYEGGKNRHLH